MKNARRADFTKDEQIVTKKKSKKWFSVGLNTLNINTKKKSKSFASTKTSLCIEITERRV